MAFDAYSSCPCGSGKKFKWCCQPIQVQIDKAFDLDGSGQHEVALQMMDQVVADNPGNPQAWGKKAQLLYQNDRVDDAENALQKALEISPQYAFGYFLRGMFRYHEGEVTGALLLLRKAAELYDPQARDILGTVYSLIGECELKLNRPVAARAAFEMALKCQPANDELRQGVDQLFGDSNTRLPAVARRQYTFQSPPPGAPGPRRQAWDRALANGPSVKLTDAARAFEQLTQEDAADAAAWYNLALVRAWLGENRGALEALDQYVAHEPDEARAGTAWALGEVLRCGDDMEDLADYLEYSALFRVRNPDALVNLLQDWERSRRMGGVQVRQDEGVLTALVLDRRPSLTAEPAPLAGLGAYLLWVGDRIRLWNSNGAAFDRVVQDLQQQVGPALSEPHSQRGPVAFNDVVSEALSFPVGISDAEEAERHVREGMQRFFEETWIHRPLRSLNQVPPVDAAGHGTLRKKLIGVIQFLEECAAGAGQTCDFDRLRGKLGLLRPSPTPATAAMVTAADIDRLGAAELAGLQTEALDQVLLEQAYQTALKLDARELAGRFARELVARPVAADRSDRYPWYAHLVQLALAEGDTDTALTYLNEGEKADCEHNDGRRRNDYELRRGQIHARRGEADEAQGVFERLIERVPSELRYRGSAAEAMLSARQGARALRFAEQGLAKAREKNDRDSEQYFLELVSAAKKQGG
jgi:tetratricopeptide (TPR) repeat protein